MPLNERSKSVLKKLAAIAGIGVAAVISYEIFYWLTHVYEYDARIEAELTTLSSRIDGEIEKVHVVEGDNGALCLLTGVAGGGVLRVVAGPGFGHGGVELSVNDF